MLAALVEGERAQILRPVANDVVEAHMRRVFFQDFGGDSLAVDLERISELVQDSYGSADVLELRTINALKLRATRCSSKFTRRPSTEASGT